LSRTRGGASRFEMGVKDNADLRIRRCIVELRIE